MLVGELSRWGNRRDEVDALLPAADRALEWITDYGDQDGDGYVEYQRTTDRGLQNQGWKDSWDSMRFADGTLAATPIALCEVQGYVYAALVARVALRDRGRRPRARPRRCDARADELKRRFNEDFWVDAADGGYFAMGLDRDKRRIDGIGSNMGHCLWTGIVDEEKAPHVARALLSDGDVQRLGHAHAVDERCAATTRSRTTAAACGRTTTRSAPPGLMRYGFVDEAHRVMRGLVDASPWFGDLLPELFSGIDRATARLPGELPDVVLAAGVGRGVAVAVPAHAAALRARHPQLASCTSRPRFPTGSARCGSTASR